MSNNSSFAPELEVSAWLNTSTPLKLADLRGKIVVIHAFQMLCPSCVSHGTPQASAIHELYANQDVQVIGLHTVFEHHDVMNVEALKAFIHEYRLQFPIAVDQAATSGPIPKTMGKYQLQGTPSLVLIDQNGQIRLNHFGRIDDMQLGDFIGKLLAESKTQLLTGAAEDRSEQATNDTQCDDNGCPI